MPDDPTTDPAADSGDDPSLDSDAAGDDLDPGADPGQGDEGGEPAAEWTPPSREDWDRVNATLKARNAKLAEARKRAAAAEAALRGAGKRKPAPAKKAPAPAAPPPAAEADDIDDGYYEDDEPDLEPRHVPAARSELASALLAAGFDGDRKAAKRLTRMIDLDDLRPDGGGEFDDDDLTEKVDELKALYPRLFERPNERRGPTRRPTTADKASDRAAPMTDPNRVTSRRLLRQAGYR